MTDEVTASLEVADQAAEGGARALDVDDFKTGATGASTEATLAALKAANHTDMVALATALAELLVLHSDIGSVLAKLSADPATQTTLAAFAAASHTDQAAILAELVVVHADLAAVLAKESADPSTGANQTSANTKLDTLHTDLAELVVLHADLAAVLAKESSDPATQTTLEALRALIAGRPAGTTSSPVVVGSTPLPCAVTSRSLKGGITGYTVNGVAWIRTRDATTDQFISDAPA